MNKVIRRVFDCHCHIIDPRFPLIANQGYIPSSFTCKDYLTQVNDINVVSGSIVSGSFQGYDQSYLTASLATLKNWVGVAQVPDTITDEEIISLKNAGVRACRFNLYRGSTPTNVVDDIVTLANRCYKVAGWHSEFYVDAYTMKEHVSRLSRLNKFSIDHLGMTGHGLPVLLDLIDAGAKVKATGFGRVIDMDIPKVLEAIASRDKNALMFGTDLPSTRAKRPFQVDDIDLIIKVLGNDIICQKVLWDNAVEFYKPNLE